jgi:hypothetical protein
MCHHVILHLVGKEHGTFSGDGANARGCRLVVIVSVEPDGAVMVRDVANGITTFS